MIKIIKNIFCISNLSKKNIITNIIAILLLTVLEICSIGIILPFLEIVTNPDYSSKFLKKVFNLDERNKLIIISILILLIFIVKNIYIFIFNYYQKKLSFKKQKNLAQRVFRNYLYLDFSKKIKISEILRDINYANNIGQWIISALQFISEFTILVVLILFLFFINFKATLLICVICLLFYIMFNMLCKTRIKRWSEENLIHSNNNYNSQLETFSGLREITISRKQNFFEKKYLNSLNELIARSFKINMLDLLPKLSLELIFVVIFMVLTFYFYLLFNTIQAIIPLLGVYFFSSLRILPAFSRIIVLTNSLNYASHPIRVLKNIFFFNQEVQKEGKLINIINQIELKNISFKYEDKYILENCNFKFDKNFFYILSGPSGIGKTTIINLLMGLLKPTDGEILIDNLNLKDCLKSFREKIGLVSQEVFIINASIAENVALGLEKKDIDYTKVHICIKLSELEEFVAEKRGN